LKKVVVAGITGGWSGGEGIGAGKMGEVQDRERIKITITIKRRKGSVATPSPPMFYRVFLCKNVYFLTFAKEVH
jgi:hypothetical protein